MFSFDSVIVAYFTKEITDKQLQALLMGLCSNKFMSTGKIKIAKQRTKRKIWNQNREGNKIILDECLLLLLIFFLLLLFFSFCVFFLSSEAKRWFLESVRWTLRFINMRLTYLIIKVSQHDVTGKSKYYYYYFISFFLSF